jgi:predicted ribosome quality control (RQC) complex YloA/Tae2 family protein
MKPRTYTLSTGLLISMGKNSANNDEVVRTAKKTELLLHTEKPGSPFVNCGEEPTKEEIYEAAILCAKHSQAWRNNKQDTKINSFYKRNMKKGIFTKEGTWKIKKYEETITVKKKDIQQQEKKQEKKR